MNRQEGLEMSEDHGTIIWTERIELFVWRNWPVLISTSLVLYLGHLILK